MRETYEFAGLKMKVNNEAKQLPTGQVLAGKEIIVEDYWQNVYGESWMTSDGNPSVLMYAMRSGVQGLPIDNNVVYGKIDGLGVLVHVSELEHISKM